MYNILASLVSCALCSSISDLLLDSTKYEVVFSDRPIPHSLIENFMDPSRELPDHSSPEGEFKGVQIYGLRKLMKFKDFSYLCDVPPKFKQETQNDSKQNELELADQVMELIEEHHEQCLYLSKGWFIYEYCHKSHIRQFHAENNINNVIEEYYLGVYDDKEIPHIGKGTNQKTVELTYKDGTKCGVNNKNRETEIIFLCDEKEQDLIVNVEELSSCFYRMIISYKRICNNKKMLRLRDETLTYIQCYPIKDIKVEHDMENVKSFPLTQHPLKKIVKLEKKAKKLDKKSSDATDNDIGTQNIITKFINMNDLKALFSGKTQNTDTRENEKGTDAEDEEKENTQDKDTDKSQEEL